MELIVVHKNFVLNGGARFHRIATSCTPLVKMTFDGLALTTGLAESDSVMIALPKQWKEKFQQIESKIQYHTQDNWVDIRPIDKTNASDRVVITNGRFPTHIDQQKLLRDLKSLTAPVIYVTVDPKLSAYQEKVRFTSNGKVAGFRRLYLDSARIDPLPTDWPHHVFIKKNVLDTLLKDGRVPLNFSEFQKKCTQGGLATCCLITPGMKFDLESEVDLLNFFREILSSQMSDSNGLLTRGKKNNIADSARLYGTVVLGDNVHIAPGATIVGPTVLGNDVRVAAGVLVRSSMIASGISLRKNQYVENRVVVEQRELDTEPKKSDLQANYHYFLSQSHASGIQSENYNYRTWPPFSYPILVKRIADFVAALVVLSLFVPVIPIIALVIKLTSSGSVFFGHTREGIHGKEFQCWKFRTMMPGADQLQSALRNINEVDGPQFKLDSDPRINAMGRFLRDTCLDEIPQFFNVLLGQMSLVGPRPSPKQENSLCPSWRDARLSVRPGITGLWQVCRTRQPEQDFQEWVYYDTQYVKTLSLRKDLWITWKTIRFLADRFLDQF